MSSSRKPAGLIAATGAWAVIPALVAVQISSGARAVTNPQPLQLTDAFKQALASGKLRSFRSLERVERLALEGKTANLAILLPWMRLSSEEKEKLAPLIEILPSLYGVKGLTEAQARKLAEFEGEALILNGLTRLSDAQAKALAMAKVDILSLNGLRRLTDTQAEALAKFKGRLSLIGLDAESRKKLAGRSKKGN